MVGEDFDLVVNALDDRPIYVLPLYELLLYRLGYGLVQATPLFEEQGLVGGLLGDDVFEDVGEWAYRFQWREVEGV